MASASCISAAGARSTVTPFKAGVAVCASRTGAASAASRVAWGGNRKARSQADWLPPEHVSPVVPDGRGGFRWNADVYRALKYLFDTVAGGINGKSLPETLKELQVTQAELVATTNYAGKVASYAQGIAAQSVATVSVVQNNSLSGATSIPPAPEPPTREGAVLP